MPPCSLCPDPLSAAAQSRLQGLAALLEILHAAHIAQRDRDVNGMLSEHLQEGLIVAARQLVRASSATDWCAP